MTPNENQPQPPVDPETTPIASSETSPSETSSPEAPAPQNPAAAGPSQPASPAPERLQKHVPWLIGVGAATAVLLLGGGGIAIGAALADDDRDDFSVSGGDHRTSEHRDGDGEHADSSTGADSDDADETETDRGNDREGDRESGSGSGSETTPGAGRAASDAASLTDAIDAAIAQASGDGATSIEVERGGWSVDVALSDGTEVEVFVAEGDSAITRESDADRNNDPMIKTAELASIIDAAVERAGGGTVESISTDSDLVRYEVSVDLGNGQDVDVELDEKLEVIGVD